MDAFPVTETDGGRKFIGVNTLTNALYAVRFSQNLAVSGAIISFMKTLPNVIFVVKYSYVLVLVVV